MLVGAVVHGQGAEDTGEMDSRKAVPLWMANVFAFSFLFCIVVVLFFYQLEEMRHTFMKDQMIHARILSSVFELHVNNALESREITDTIVERLLSNIGRFIDYLDAFEPFAPQELEGFSHRIGLFGVAILRGDGVLTTGVREWQNAFPYECSDKTRFFRDEARHMFILAMPRHDGMGCVVCALPSRDFEALQKKLGLEAVIEALREVPGVVSISLSKRTLKHIKITPMLKQAQVMVYIPTGDGVLDVALDARLYRESLERLWRNFLLISAFILLLGGGISYWLYRRQQAAMLHAIRMEKALGRQREEAMIGRAAATIAHEIRNPMNALHMGLQRVLLEAPELSGSQRRILELGIQSIKRVNGIISNLLEFARPVAPKKEDVDMERLVEDVVCFMDLEAKGLRIERLYSACPCRVKADPELMRQLFLNLLKNAQEAQPGGGFLRIQLEQRDGGVEIVFENGGELPDPGIKERLLEPYFTTKTSGSGIGLPFSKRIVEAHGGHLEVRIESGTFRVTLWLPG